MVIYRENIAGTPRMSECEYETNSISIFDYQFANVLLFLFFMMLMTLGDKTMFNRKSFIKRERGKESIK